MNRKHPYHNSEPCFHPSKLYFLPQTTDTKPQPSVIWLLCSNSWFLAAKLTPAPLKIAKAAKNLFDVTRDIEENLFNKKHVAYKALWEI